MQNFVYIIPAFLGDRPQSIRHRNILKYLNNKSINVFVLTNDKVSSIENFSQNSRVKVVKYKSSKFGALVNKFYYPHNIYNFNEKIRFFGKYIRFFLKLFTFPDLFILEAKALRKEIELLSNKMKIDTIVICSAPHSLFTLSKFIRNNGSLKASKLVLDIGDPLFNNSVKKQNKLRNQLAYLFELKYLKYFDYLIVTNNETKQHYISLYQHRFKELVIEVVPMGGEIKDESILGEKNLPLLHTYKMVYAGIFYKDLREPISLFEAISLFNRSHTTKFKLHIYGQGLTYFKNKLAESSKKDIIFNDSISHSKIIKLYEDFDIVVHIDNAYGLQTPGKNFEIFLTNKPVLFIYKRRETTAFKLFENQPGVFLARNEVSDIVNSLNNIAASALTYNRLENMKNSEVLWENRSKQFFKIIQ